MDGKEKIKECYHSLRGFAGEQKRKIEHAIQKEKDLRKLDDVVKTNSEKSGCYRQNGFTDQYS